MDIYFYEAFEEEGETLRSLLGNDFTFGLTAGTIQESGHGSPPARLISIRTQSEIPTGWAHSLDGILSRSTGFDHLVDYRSRTGAPLHLGFLEEYASRAVAEHAMMSVMALLRKLPQQIRQFPTFNRDGIMGFECEGRNLLVVGVGRIGSEIVRVAAGLGFEVKGIDLVPDKPGVSYVAKKEGIAWADVIVCAMNLTEVNRGYFSFDLLSRGKKGRYFVNISRGEQSPLGDLDRLLREGWLAGVGLDVFDGEGELAVALRNPASGSSGQATLVHKLLEHPNVLLTPHNAFNSKEALQRKSELTVQQLRYFLEHRDFLWKV